MGIKSSTFIVSSKSLSQESKCDFGDPKVKYLGHIVDKDGVYVDPKKIEAMKDWLCPKTFKSLKGFLGLTGYYHKFVQNYGKLQPRSLLSLKIMLSVRLQSSINPSNY
jgi:hypothetical protein